MENLVYLFSCFLSCVIIAGLMFRFMGDRYEKAFVNQWVYRIAVSAGILKPLVSEEYSDNPMLNILLADRKQAAESIGIRFVVRVESTGLEFIEPVDVTTLFGNLLENAMQAVLKCCGERCIKVHIRNYNEMLSIRIENSVEKEVRIKNGKPVSTGGKFYSDVILNR